MALFAAARQARKDDAELGKGVWRRGHDRFRRGVDRYHQILEGVQQDDLYAELLPIGDELGELLPRVRTLCADAQQVAPSTGSDIPAGAGGYLADVHRALSRAGGAIATTAEAAAMCRLDAERLDAERLDAEGLDAERLDAEGLDAEGSGPHASTGASVGVENVRRRAAQAVERVADAERRLAEEHRYPERRPAGLRHGWPVQVRHPPASRAPASHTPSPPNR